MAQNLVDQLLALDDTSVQRQFLEECVAQLNGSTASTLKQEADRHLRANVGQSLKIAGLIQYLAQLTGNPFDQALGLLAEANARAIGLGEYPLAIALYDQATAIYAQGNLPVEQAKAQVGKIGALSFLGRYQEAMDTGVWARRVLETSGEWQPLATMTMNLAIMHARMGEDAAALSLFSQAGELYAQIGEAGKAGWLWVQINRAFVLRNLGQFDASIKACQTAQRELAAMGQTVAAARAQQNLALTHFILGQYNEALKGLDQVRDVFLTDGRRRDAVLVDLFVSNCLLQLRRYHDVLSVCRQVRSLFSELGAQDVAAKAILNEGVAYAGLGQYNEALRSLEEAKSIFAQVGNQVWVASSDLEIAAIQRSCGDYEPSLATAQACAAIFRSHQLPVEEANAYLVAARSALPLNRPDTARSLAAQALTIGQERDVASVIYQSHYLLGILAGGLGHLERALESYEVAIEQLERLRGRLMVEFRADFLEDKAVVYEDAVLACLELNRPLTGLAYVERAKSRALVDMIAYRLDLSIEAREPEDLPIVEELMQLRAQRDQLYRRWQSKEELKARGSTVADGGWEKIEHEVLEIENRITKLWHTLLVHNADYAREAVLWRVQVEPIQPYLDHETALIEFYVAKKTLLAFVVTREQVNVHALPVDMATVQTLQRLLRLNFDSVPRSPATHIPGLEANARTLLQRLYQALLAPLDADIGAYPRWIIVPHAALHYLPFQALHDGSQYMVERHEISYLPGASLLRFCQEPRQAAAGMVAIGHSFDGQLPNTVHEARSIHEIFGGEIFLEQDATPARLRESARTCRVVHLAAHGDFRPDNPLFSGLALSGGWLTTLDIFNLRLDASLVTLSACQTGRSTIGGGDELLGLMRALLYAGAASLVLTLWTVEDRSTAHLMEQFYLGLAAGRTKGAALRNAQLAFVRHEDLALDAESKAFLHPYFWAPFFLVGDAGPL